MPTSNNLKKIMILVAIAVIAVSGLVVLLQYILESRYVTVNFSDIKEVKFYELRDQEHAEEKPDASTATVTSSGTQIRLLKNQPYSYTYTSSSGDYKDGQGDLAADAKDVTIRPEFSDEKITQLAESIRPTVVADLNSRYDGLDKYHFIEEWVNRDETYYITGLKYVGDEDILGTDTLKTIFHKDNGTWKMACKPAIVLTTTECPDVSRDLLVRANRIALY